MDESLKHHNPNPSLTANPLSKLFFWWLNPLFKTGYVRQLEVDDMYNVVHEDQSDVLGLRLEKEWQKEVERTKDGKRKPSLLRALFRMFGFEYILMGMVLFLEEATKVIQPLLLGGLIRYFTPDSTMTKTEGYLYAAGVSLCAIVLAVAHHPYFFGVQRIGMKMRVACCSLLYRKSLRLSNAGLSKTTTGQIVNLMSNDVNRFDQAVIFLHFLWIGPLEAIAVLAILWKELGPSTLAGFAVLLFLVPVQGWMGKLFSKFRQKTAKHTDERVRVMNEIISGMRVIKMYCWEKPFGDMVAKIRGAEIEEMRKKQYLLASWTSFSRSGRYLCILISLLVLVQTGTRLKADGLYVLIRCALVFEAGFCHYLPWVLIQGAETKVALERMELESAIIYHGFSYREPKLRLRQYEWRKENDCIWQTKILSANVACIWVLAPRFLYFVVVVTAMAVGLALRPQLLYICLPLLFLVAQTMIGVMSLCIQFCSEFVSSVKRITTFLKLEELEDQEPGSGEQGPIPLKDCHIEVDCITAKWDQEIEQPTLQKVSASVSPGKLLAVIGPVGAGKSSLLMSVLRELPVSEGSVKVKGRIAYVSQQPWVFSASLRQNVVFGNKYEKSKYDRILKACALNKDVAIMPHGDLTLIGDRGVSLSGGQRARVSLARSLYMDADVYLLDDPLSAVDAAVGRHIFNNVIQGVLKDKPRILVTHQLQFLKEAAEILILKDGEMIGKGSFQDLSVSGIDFASLLKREKEEEEKCYDSPKSAEQMHINGHPHGIVRLRSRDSSCSRHSVTEKGSMMSLNSIGTEFEAEMVQLPDEEECREGTVTGRVYLDYFMAGAGVFKSIVLIILCLLAQCAYIASDWWLSYWSNQEEAKYAAMLKDEEIRAAAGLNATSNATSNANFTTGVTIPFVDTNLNVGIFSAIIGSVFLFGLLRALMFFRVTVDASQHLHNKMFASILRSHIGFFDTNPVGRILNRFTKDIGQMDDILPVCFFDFVQCSLLIIGIVIVAGVVNPWVFIPVVPLIVLFVIIRRYYLRTSRHIKRLEGTTRSPVYSHLSASLQGLHTIRAFGWEEKFIEEFDTHQDLHTEAWFLFLSTSRWLAVRLDWLCAMFIAAVSFSCILAAESLNAGLVGLSMTYAMTLMGMFQWGVRQSAEVENQMISVERVIDYSKLPSEAPLEAEEKKQPPSDWPEHGVIRAENACLRYADNLPLVLKDLTFTIKAREKVGIVGRTGAGKSSLITMLFRLVEPTGVIMIDDINIQNIGLHDLRKLISIIPQDPVLFMGTLRRNLDPFNHHSDEALWRALGEVQLKQAVEDLPHGVDSEVSEGGVNFSVGQRQLICLARAILRNNRILMIDEATANVDPRTDALIQQTLREKFNKCTVLTIAHRLHTIMDSDRILVMDEGHIVEFEAPYILLQQSDSLLKKLVDQTGKAEVLHLLDIAKVAYEKSGADGNIASLKPVDGMAAVSSHDVSVAIDEREEIEEEDAEISSASDSSSSSDTDSKSSKEDLAGDKKVSQDVNVNAKLVDETKANADVEAEAEDVENFDEGARLLHKEKPDDKSDIARKDDIDVKEKDAKTETGEARDDDDEQEKSTVSDNEESESLLKKE